MTTKDPLRLAANRLNRSAPPGERVAYVNPAEESLMRAFGGSGKSVNGIPSYQAVPGLPGYGEALGESAAAQLALITGERVTSPGGKVINFGGLIPRGLEDIVAAERPGRLAAAQLDTEVLERTLAGEGKYKAIKIGGDEAAFRAQMDVYEKKIADYAKQEADGAKAGKGGMMMAGREGKRIYQAFLQDAETSHKRALELGEERWINPTTGEAAEEGDVFEGKGLIDLYGPKGQRKYATEEDVAAAPERKRRIAELTAEIPNMEVGTKGQRADKAKAAKLLEDLQGMEDLQVGDFMGYSQAGRASAADVAAGRADEVGEFMGLTSGAQDAAEYMARRQREADIVDVERLGGRATAAFREQGDIAGALTAARDLGPGGTRPATAADVTAGRATAVGELIVPPSALLGGAAAGPAAEQVREMYLRTVGREPDAEGLQFWAQKLQAGATPEQMESALLSARAGGDSGAVMEGRLQAQARALGAGVPEAEKLASGMPAITAPVPEAPTGYAAERIGAMQRLGAPTRYEALDEVGGPTMDALTDYTADVGVTGGRIGGAFEPTFPAGAPTAAPTAAPAGAAGIPDDADLAAGLRRGGTEVGTAGIPVDWEARDFRAPAAGAPTAAAAPEYGTDPLRRSLMMEAQQGLGAGLTERERRNIEQASRTASGARGRMRDYGSIVGEVTALTEEDRQRQAINRAFAQQALGQEAGLQESDLGRDFQAQLARQSALNRQREFGVGAGLQQEQAREQMAMQGRMADVAAEQQRRQYGVGAGMEQEQFGAQIAQQRALANAEAANRAAQFGVGAGIGQEQFGAQQDIAAQLANLEAGQQARQFDIAQEAARRDVGVQRELGAAGTDIQTQLAQRELAERQRQAGLAAERAAATQMVGLETATSADPFAAILNRDVAGAIPSAAGMAQQANYGLVAGPQFVTPQTGLGFISAKSAADAGMYGAQQQAEAARSAGKQSMTGSLISGGSKIASAALPLIFGCWVAREVYGIDNPKWLRFRDWMFNRAPDDLREYYLEHGPAIADNIRGDEPAKARMRDTMNAILEGA